MEDREVRPDNIPKLENYTPSKFMLPTSHYDEAKADRAVAFIEQLCHTKGKWAGMRFWLLPWQERIVRDIFGTVKSDGNRQFRTAYIETGKKNGKELALDTPIPTPFGFKTMGDLQIGDTVFDENGEPCHVVAKSEVDDTEQPFRLIFRDGTSIVAGENHLWDVECRRLHPKHRVMKTREIFEKQEQYNRSPEGLMETRSVIRIPVTKPLQLPYRNDLPVDPYLYGYWLGNGTSRYPEITVRDSDLLSLLSFIPYRPENIRHQPGSYKIKYPILKMILVDSFRDKKIRPEYLRASEYQRWALLQGLMDSDGSVSTYKSQSVYVSTVKPLAESVRELLWSLGIKNAMAEEPSTRYGIPTGETLYTIRFTTFEDQPTTRLMRKTERTRERKGKTRSNFHYLKSIEPLDHKVKMQCIQVDSRSHCYLAGTSFVPTHNSELAAAVALYLLYADGEASAEVYGAAADRQQASIVFDVAHQMVNMCPALYRRSKIMAATKRIVNYSNAGFYQVLSAEVSSHHGLNVSGLIFDELHAQPNRKLYDVLTQGSGDAREQPLYFIITTAGTDRNSICYELHQKAKDILNGQKVDPTFYPVVYGLEDGEDWKDEKNWYKANPSLGQTIQIDRVRDQFRQALENPAEEAVFKQLRLNMWVSSTTAFIPEEVFNKGNTPIDLASLRGRECYGGLDLSSTGDITALVLMFPPRTDDENYICLPYFWVPEDTIPLRVRRASVPYDVWVKQGYMNATEGNVIDYNYIRKFINDLYKIYNIREIGVDRWNATQLIIDLTDDGLTMVPFGQGFRDLSAPTKEFYKLMMEGKIQHGGNPVLRWMALNVVVDRDAADNIKPTKAKSPEKIDGIVASIMALDRCIRHENDESVYDERGILFV